jgi:molybdopterin-binding protein
MEKIAANAIITTKLADGSVTSAKILDGAVTAVDLADGAVITIKIANNSITTVKLADGSVTSAKILDGTILTEDLATGAVTASKIADGSIITVKLADGAVTSAKILDGTITAVDLATGAVTTIKIADGAVTTVKIADYAVTNLKLASYAIPFASTYGWFTDSTDSTLTWVDMDDMSVSITLQRTSHLLILFSAEAKADYLQQILVQALVGESVADPGYIYLTPIVQETGWAFLPTHSHALGYGAYAYNFYRPSVSAGTYTIKIQWRVTGGTGYVGDRTLTIIALPA